MMTPTGPRRPNDSDRAHQQPERPTPDRTSDLAANAPDRSPPDESTSANTVMLARLMAGHPDALDGIFRRYATPLIRYAARIVSSDAVAQDIVMDVFMRLWRSRLTLSADTNLDAYLRTSVRNACMNHLRHNRIEASVEELGAASGWTPAMSATPLMPDEDLERREAKETIRRALAELSPRMRLVLEMRWLDEKSYKEIANELGLQVRSVETSVARAMRILRDRMKGNGGTK